ncbi:MAG TPA: IclR family transcriptional regulator [Dehalococcoidales bacterium]|nr:IclR family transcriptional regulator [Dehalococcoidales bacterium]
MKVIEKAMKLLNVFLEHGTDLSLDEMSKMTRMHKTTVRRIAVSLVKVGFLRQPVKRGKYCLGMKFLDFTKAIKSHNLILDVAAPYLQKLSQEVEETVALALWDGESAFICQTIHPDYPLKVIANEGKIIGLHFTSLGKAILAELPEPVLKRLCLGHLEKSTPNSITDFDELHKHLAVIKQQGFALDDEEYSLGVRGVASVFKDRKGTVMGAISVLGPSVRLSRERLREFAAAVKKFARQISVELGHTKK